MPQPESSLPVAKPQPNAALYPANALELFNTYSRASFLSTFGSPAMAFDPTRRPKAWFDTSVDGTDLTASVSYTVFHQHPRGGGWIIEPISMTAQEALQINLPPDERPAGSPALEPYWEVPVRALLPGESLAPNPFGLFIQRADLQQQVDEAAGKFTSHDRAVLAAVAVKLGIDPTTL